MTPEQWLSVSILLLLATNLATALYAVHHRQRADAAERRLDAAPAAESGPDPDAAIGFRGGDPDAAAGFRGGDPVTCTDCGSENDRQYRYCRNCAAELPGVWLDGRNRVGPDGGSME